MTTEIINQIARHAEARTSVQTIALTHPRAGEDLFRLQTDYPQLNFVRANGTDWHAHVAQAQAVLLGRSIAIDELLDHAPQLQWIHTIGAGVDRLMSPRLRGSDIVLTNSSGVHAINIAEHILALVLSFARQLHVLGRAQALSQWRGPGATRPYPPLPGVFELEGQTLAVIGLGAIGQALSRKADALGLRVLGVRRTASSDPVPGVSRLYDVGSLDAVLLQADHVAITLPLTEQTRGLFDAQRLSKLRRGAHLYNIGRGAIVDSEALLRALNSGGIAGAGLDVTDPEPLPPESPLWQHPNVIITAHTSGSTPHNARRTLEIFSDNIGRVLRGEPLRNIVNKELGY